MKAPQKALFLHGDRLEDGRRDLQKLLDQGYRVAHTFPAREGYHSFVILDAPAIEPEPYR